MALFPFIGESYVYRSVAFDLQRSVNIYPVKSEPGNSKSPWGMEGSPGLDEFLTFPKFPVRNGINVNGRVFFVAGNGFYEVFADTSFIERGTIGTTTGSISIATNGNQVCVVDNPDGYIFDLTTDTLTQITDPYYLGAVTVTFDSGNFVFNKPDSQMYFWSALYDGTTGDPLDFASAEGLPDNLVAVKSVHQQVWLYGASTVQVVAFGTDGYQTVQGSLIQYGCASPYAIAQTANVVLWIGQDNDGNAMVWQANGYQPQRVSTHAIEYYLGQYSASIPDAISYTYEEDGHYWLGLIIPGMPTGLFYDIELQQWHERGYFSDGSYSRPRQNCHVFAYGFHLMGDYQNGILYSQSLDLLDDNGQSIRRLRTAPYIADDLEYIYFQSFQLDMQTGVGLDAIAPTTDLADQPNYDPQICLRWTDNGHTWSNDYFVSAGKIGEYNARALWRRLGRGRQRAFEVTYTPATKVFWIAAHIKSKRGTN